MLHATDYWYRCFGLFAPRMKPHDTTTYYTGMNQGGEARLSRLEKRERGRESGRGRGTGTTKAIHNTARAAMAAGTAAKEGETRISPARRTGAEKGRMDGWKATGEKLGGGGGGIEKGRCLRSGERGVYAAHAAGGIHPLDEAVEVALEDALAHRARRARLVRGGRARRRHGDRRRAARPARARDGLRERGRPSRPSGPSRSHGRPAEGAA